MFLFQALDGFIMVFSSSGKIFYASESITSLLGHLPVSAALITEYFSISSWEVSN
jgi:circadian locomoter output cycle kaput protein